MSGGSSPRQRRVAVLSADAVGYSRRMAEDLAATVAALRSRRETIGGHVREHKGRIAGTAGDNLLAIFDGCIDAVACAIAIQNDLGELEATLPEDARLRFRIGLHLGDVLEADGEIFGDGINVAARLEGLALPGGVCASATVVEAVRGKVEGNFEDLGEQELKNIPAPVRVFRVRAPGGSDVPLEAATIPGFGGRPVIAVLPFESRTTDPQYDYLAEGIVEDLVSRLSAFRLFPVISRSSTSSYAGRRVDTRQVSRELRARYLVLGSVQGAAGRVRVHVELVDGSRGVQIHSERHDRRIDDVFDLQDRIVLDIVNSIEPALGRAEGQRAQAKAEPQLDAWECFQKGAALLFRLRAKEELLTALALFRRARELDPRFATAAALEGVCHAGLLTYHWGDPALSIPAAREAAAAALALDENDAWAHAAAGYACNLAAEPAAALPHFERAIDRNPSLTMAYQGLAVALTSDHPDEAIRVMEKAIRLSPRDQQMHFLLHQLAVAHLVAGRYEDAVRHECESLRLRDDQPHGYRVLAAALGHLGRAGDAREALATMQRIAPSFSLDIFRRTNSRRLVDACIEGWRLAGWSE